jgi:hypothetical protein
MSFNTTKVNNKTPGPTGNVVLEISDHSDVSGPFSADDTLIYDANTSTWQAQAVPSAVGVAEYALFGQGESDDYSNSGFSLGVNNTWGFYDSSPINTISNYVSFNKVTGTDWLESITLEAGKYEVFAQTSAEFSATGALGVRVHDSSTNDIYSNLAVTGGDFSSAGAGPTCVMGALVISSQTTLYFKTIIASNLATSQGNTPSEQGVVLIRKVA